MWTVKEEQDTSNECQHCQDNIFFIGTVSFRRRPLSSVSSNTKNAMTRGMKMYMFKIFETVD